ncbi:MAG TPA: DUF3619 family protein [Rhodocyclaceae bacterium]|nr:DUF3619 family protein [Rhodocyclaceae bacterium]HNL23018.1 DUF3619 family protein [Rhodocyclaceae bacterium]
MTDEMRFALKIRQALDQGCSQMDPAVADRLARARAQALSHQKTAETRLALLSGSADLIFPDTATQRAKGFIAIAALVLGMTGAYYWNEFQAADENADVDSALLADELPIDAYTDQGFGAWIEHSSQLPQ